MAQRSLTGYDANSQRVQHVATATQPDDAVPLSQVQGLITARSPKDDVIVRVNTNLNLSAPGATLDGISMSAGMRFLATGQTTGSQNGIYDWTGAATPATRSSDADSITDLSGAVVAVQRGTSADTIWLCTNDDTDTLGTTTVTFVQVGATVSYTADGQGIEVVGSTFSLELDTASGLVKSATGLKIDVSVVARKFAANCVATTNPQTFNHALGTSDVDVSIREVSSGKLVLADVTVVDTGNVSVDFGAAPSAGQYRVIVHG